MIEPHDPNVTSDIPSAAADSGRAADALCTTDHVRASASADGSPPGTAAPASNLPAVPGYHVLREIARGGMGRVLAAYDLTLDRDVALKVLLPGANSDRFVRESKITARLPHPGIPPVHALGTLADGSPFLAMKLIAGRTLAEEMKSADRPRLLQAFVQVCQAVGFAHSRGIIHRDLKPANVMVGAFGEVQVMDWGLATDKKDEGGRIKDQEKPECTCDSSFIPHPSSLTQAGTVLGTPAYMAPEQARGETTDARADVFALGGMLCAILTGQPPYSGKSTLEVIRRAEAADLAEADARLERCGAEAELIALCRRCLSPNPADRPGDGQTVADGLTAYLHGVQERLQAAERERAVAVAREAEQRKRRKLQLALAAAVAVLLLGGGAVAWWQNEQASARRATDLQRQLEDEKRLATDNSRLGRNAEAVIALLGQCEEALTAGDAAKAAAALDAARKRAAEGGAENHAERLVRLESDLALLRQLDAVDQFRWTMVNNKLANPADVAKRTREALRRFGADPEAVSVEDAATRVSASVVRDRIVEALDMLLLPIRLADWDKLSSLKLLYTPQARADVAALLPKAAGVRDLLRRVDPDVYRDAVRDAVMAEDRAKFVDLAKEFDAKTQPPRFASFLGECPAIEPGRRLELLKAALIRRPGHWGLLMMLGNTAEMLDQKKPFDERIRWSQAAIAAAPDKIVPYINLGAEFFAKGQMDEASAWWKKALELDPKNAVVHYNLGAALHFQRRPDEAIKWYKKAIELDPKIADFHSSLANTLLNRGQVVEAIACCRKAIELDSKDTIAYVVLGNALVDKRRWEEAIASYKKALEFDPKLPRTHSNLGVALKYQGRLDEAIESYRKAIELDPEYADAHYNLGDALADKRQWEEAIAYIQKAIAFNPKFAKAHGRLGQILLLQGRYAEAKESSTRALTLLPKQHNLWASASGQVQQCERLLQLEERLPGILRGEDKSGSAQDSLDLAQICRLKRIHAAAARFSAEAFTADPKLADFLPAKHRYNAASSAALAGAGQGDDAAKLDDAAKAKLRGQALDWLKADLAVCTKLLDSGPPQARPFTVKTLSHWQKEGDLASIREKAALAKLPADEQKAFAQLWADVAALLQKAKSPAAKEGK